MYVFFKKYFIVWTAIFSFQGSLMAFEEYIARPVDCNNSLEIKEVVNFYLKHRPYSPPSKGKGGKNHRSLKNHSQSQPYHDYLQSIKDKISESNNHVTFVCISQKTNKISGLLFCRYGYRRTYLAEFQNCITDKDACKDSMLALIQGAEKYFVQKSIKKIAASVWSKKEFELYLQNEFYVMDSDAQAQHYSIGMDAVLTILSVIFVIPVLIQQACYYGVVCKDLVILPI